jgi:hypothetical protein
MSEMVSLTLTLWNTYFGFIECGTMILYNQEIEDIVKINSGHNLYIFWILVIYFC